MTQPHALVVFESMFGNTATVAEAVAEGLRDRGVLVAVRHVAEVAPLDDVAPELLVVGAPTHAFSLSRPSTRADAVAQGAPPDVTRAGVREWLTAAGRNSGTGRRAVAFDTRVASVRRLPLSAAGTAGRLLRRKGFARVLAPQGFLVAGTKGDLLPGELARARAWGARLAEDILFSPSAPTTRPSYPTADPSGW